MKAYLVAAITVKNTEQFSDYLDKIPKYVEKYQGTYLVKGGSPVSFEGEWCPEKMVIIEFPNPDLLQGFLSDDGTRRTFIIRHQSTDSHLITVNGID